MGVKGVRSSWLTLARNSVFIRSTSCSRVRSARTMTRPCLSASGATLNRTGTFVLGSSAQITRRVAQRRGHRVEGSRECPHPILASHGSRRVAVTASHPTGGDREAAYRIRYPLCQHGGEPHHDEQHDKRGQE